MKNNFIPLLFWFILFVVCIEGCIESERDALLEFKNGLTDPSNFLFDWVANSSNCCSWSGVVCHNLTSHVIELHLRTLSPQEYFGPDLLDYFIVINSREYEEYKRKTTLGGKVSSALLHLKHLTYLDLSNNDFGGVAIPEFIGSMQSLRYLNFSWAGFGGMIPQLGNLSNLNYLNLGSNHYDYLFGTYNDLKVENLDWVTSLSSLEFLDLSYVNLSQSFDWLKVMNSVSSLVELHLSSCNLPSFSYSSVPNLNFSSLSILDLSGNYFGGPIPNGLQNMSSLLRELDLSWNLFDSSIPNWLYHLTHLQLLHLRANWLQGRISSGIGNLSSLVSLDLSINPYLEFEKGIPNSFQNFCQLRSLSLSLVKMNQEINDVLSIMSRCNSTVLQSLEFWRCNLSGHLTDDLARFKNLVTFDISANSISGSIPLSFGNLNKLEKADISNNKLEGEVSQLHFANLTRLVDFRAYGMTGNISLRVSSNWIPPLQLRYLRLSSWNIGPQFPKWLRPLKRLALLDLSNSRISSPIPIWSWEHLFPKLTYLNISHNKMHGSIPNFPFSNGSLLVIDLSSNNFSGAIPCFSSNINVLDLSHNSFTGSLFNFLCCKMNEEKRMEVLNFEGNLLQVEIPDYWGSWRNLVGVILSSNSFSGNIPNSIGTLRNLTSLHLRNNNLSGEVPSSIRNCTQLFVLDLSENSLGGNITTWIGDSFSELIILNLHANKFNGYLSKELCDLVSLHVLDLSNNRFFGTIPSCFGKFNAIATRGDYSWGSLHVGRSEGIMERIFLVMKRNVMEYSNNLGFVRSIDLSNNHLAGEIPTEITNLTELLSLNLSRNALTGRIPKNIGIMKALEVIDFSHNQLSGEVPQSMSNLTFLGTLDLSYNNFSGRIPSGTQLQGFDSSSFMGNHLCGLPLANHCTLDNSQPNSHTERDDENEVDVWFYENMAIGFGFGFWGVVGSLVFIKKWRHFYFHSLYRAREIVWWNIIGRIH